MPIEPLKNTANVKGRKTRLDHQNRINDALHYIHRNLSGDLRIRSLAASACYSDYHFQRLFKRATGETVHEYIKRSRLEWAANLLIFNPSSEIQEVAQDCGFQSNSSFYHAFKAHTGYAPSEWRATKYQKQVHQEVCQTALPKTLQLSEASVHELPDFQVAYVRHRGYDASIHRAWQKLRAWCASQPKLDFDAMEMIGLHHSNPNIVPLAECHYVACLVISEPVFRSAGVSSMSIPGGLYACWYASGNYGDILALWSHLYYQWLPASDYEALSIPPHTRYLRNHLLHPDVNADSKFDIEFRMPVRLRF